MNWKEEVIAIIKNNRSKLSFEDMKTIMQQKCQEICTVKDYNYHCQRCKLYKFLLKESQDN